jgi:hypothetical protein
MNGALLKRALVGTSRAGALAPPDREHPAEALLAGLTACDPETDLLLRAGLQAVFSAAGRRADEAVAPLPAAPPETARRPGDRLAGLLRGGLTLDASGLFGGLLDELAARNLRLPHELLPEVLTLSDPTLRQKLLPVLGERGRWLAGLNPYWAWGRQALGTQSEAPTPDHLQRLLQEADLPERCRALGVWRRLDPAAAREFLAGTLAGDSADVRGRLVSELAARLSPADEPFLETCLDDRSAVVRRVAAQLLARLPDSGLAGRMRDRGQAMLTSQKGGLVFQTLTLACAPPEAIDKGWERDGIPRKPAGGGGQRAGWVEGVFELIRPSHWVTHFGATPEELLAGLRDDPFGPSLVAGWSRACRKFATDDPTTARWILPLLDHWEAALDRQPEAERGSILEQITTLLPALDPGVAEARVLDLIEHRRGREETAVLGLLDALPGRWSDRSAQRFLEQTRSVLRQASDGFATQWISRLPLAARAIPPGQFSAALQPWDLSTDKARTAWSVAALEREIDRFQEVVRLRRDFHEVVSSSSSS